MDIAGLVLLIAGVLALLAAAFGASHPRVHFGWLGAALIAIAMLVQNIPG